ncbi:MAG: flagellar filament capping protein FliD [Lachnospiraceae bacterium]|nr:flagellar filament capping protein FliD [Lachnospiraceae bacterium]
MANNIAILNNIHNFYLSTYADKTNSPYDTHKKSELRGVYNSIVKINKDSPLYILDNTDEGRQYVVGVKENARSLKNAIASVGGLDEDDILNKKAAATSDESLVEAKFIGDIDEDSGAPEFDIEVKHLASPQINLGRFLPNDEAVELEPDTYSFDVNIKNNGELRYEFQFNIKNTDTNREVQDRLARLINNSNVGLNAEVISDDSGERSYLRVESIETGAKDGTGIIFSISDADSSKASGAVEYFGLDYTSRIGSDAEFTLNGEPKTASSNNFTVGQMYELTLKGVSPEGQQTHVGLMTDVESMTENISTLIDGYNTFVRTAAEYSDTHPISSRLVNEMSAISRAYAEGLTEVGVNLNVDGTLELDEETFKKSVREGSAAETASSIKGFAQTLLRKSNDIALNPLNYADKTIVAYKNPGKTFASPYTMSAYSGMLFNSYC